MKRWVWWVIGIAAVGAAVGLLRVFRLEIIRAAIHLPLPGWIFYLIWGW